MKDVKYFILILLSSCSTFIPNEMKPLLVEDTLHINNVSYHDTVYAQLKFVNPNKQKIKVQSFTSSCGCIVYDLKDSIIKGNDSAFIQIIYTPAASGDSGAVTKTIAIRTNANPPLKSVVIKGFVEKGSK